MNDIQEKIMNQEPISKEEFLESTTHLQNRIKFQIFVSVLAFACFIFVGAGWIYNQNYYGIVFATVMLAFNITLFVKELLQLKAVNHIKGIFKDMSDEEYVTFKLVADNTPSGETIVK